MKNIKDLKGKVAIHCPTFKIWKKVLKLNETNDLINDFWLESKSKTCYAPLDFENTGAYGSKKYLKKSGYEIIDAKDFFKPKTPEQLANKIIKILKKSDLDYNNQMDLLNLVINKITIFIKK